MIGNGYAMGVAAEIPQYLRWAAKCRLRIHDPVLSMQSAQQFGKLLGIRQNGSRTSAAQLFAAVEPFETVNKLAPEYALKHLHRQRYVAGDRTQQV